VERTLPVSRQAARAVGQVNNATARLRPGVLPAQEAPRAKVAQPERPVDKAETLVLADGPAALAGNSQAAEELRGPEVLPAREALLEAGAPLVPAVPPVLAALQALAASAEREA
jgi:hypothetical protein